MKRYTVHQAKSQLSRLIQQALQGEEVVILNRDKPVVKLEPVAPRKRRQLGLLKGEVWMSEDFNKTPNDFKDYE